MKETTKTIFLGILITITMLIASIGSMYILTKDKSDTNRSWKNTNTNNNLKEEQNKPEKPSIETKPTTEKIVTLYLFRGEGCPHCEHALEYFDTIKSKYDYLNIESYEVWYNEENAKLLNDVKAQIGVEKTGVPLIVIGSNYHLVGYGSRRNSEIENAILKAYEDPDYHDIVKETIDKENYNITKD